MGFLCGVCGTLISGEHMPKKCKNCGNEDRIKFLRADEKDLTPTPRAQKNHEIDKKYLESRREN